MAQLRFRKVTTLPGTLDSDSFYFVQNGNYAEAYVTNSAGQAKAVGNSTMITAIANNLITSALADFNALEIVSNISARDSLAASAARNLMILVTDATGDPTVQSGAALYAYSETSTSFTKLSEYESMDVVIQWAAIQGKPTSSPAQIDNAVSLAHTHANKTTIDKFSEDGEGVLFNGSPIAARWVATDW